MTCIDDSNYFAMSELINEIGHVVQNAFDNGLEELTLSDIEYILKMAVNVTTKIKHSASELTV